MGYNTEGKMEYSEKYKPTSAKNISTTTIYS